MLIRVRAQASLCAEKYGKHPLQFLVTFQPALKTANLKCEMALIRASKESSGPSSESTTRSRKNLHDLSFYRRHVPELSGSIGVVRWPSSFGVDRRKDEDNDSLDGAHSCASGFTTLHGTSPCRRTRWCNRALQ